VAGLEVIRPEPVWVAESTSIRPHNAVVSRAVVRDVVTRGLRGWNLGRGLEGARALTAWKRALDRGRPAIHHSDQGVQDAAPADTELLAGRGVSSSRAAVDKPEENGVAERRMRTIKEEEMDPSECEDLADARRHLSRFLDDVDNTKRIHASLGDVTPAACEQQGVDMEKPETSVIS
jgi:putative transposase